MHTTLSYWPIHSLYPNHLAQTVVPATKILAVHQRALSTWAPSPKNFDQSPDSHSHVKRKRSIYEGTSIAAVMREIERNLEKASTSFSTFTSRRRPSRHTHTYVSTLHTDLRIYNTWVLRDIASPCTRVSRIILEQIFLSFRKPIICTIKARRTPLSRGTHYSGYLPRLAAPTVGEDERPLDAANAIPLPK